MQLGGERGRGSRRSAFQLSARRYASDMWFEDASKARVVEVLDEIHRLLVEPKSQREAMPLAQRADALMCRVARWLRKEPTEDEVHRTRDEVLVLLNEVVAMVGSTSSAN